MKLQKIFRKGSQGQKYELAPPPGVYYLLAAAYFHHVLLYLSVLD